MSSKLYRGSNDPGYFARRLAEVRAEVAPPPPPPRLPAVVRDPRARRVMLISAPYVKRSA